MKIPELRPWQGNLETMALVQEEAWAGFFVYAVNHRYGELMGAVKTTIVIDEQLWQRLRESILRRHGSYRKLGETVQESVRIFDAEGTLAALLSAAGIEPGDYPSSAEVIASRPKVNLSAGEVIREMRSDRVDSISGLKRSGEEVC